MGRIGIEKLLANLRDTFGYDTNKFTIIGDAAMIMHGVINEVDKPILMVDLLTIQTMASKRGVPLKDSTDEVYGKVQYIDMGNVLIITTSRLPTYHCVEDIGPFKVETLSTIIMLLLVGGFANKPKIQKCIDAGGYLLLEAWYSDLTYINNNYSSYPEYYEIIEPDEEGGKSQVMWKTLQGIEAAKGDHIFLEYVGMMYIETN